MKREDVSPRVIERFWARVEKGPACWLWRGATVQFGYGVLMVRGTRTGAHRLSYLLANGSLPSGVVRHACDTPACVNPAHLIAGTVRDNMRDVVARGRQFSMYRNATHCRQGHEFTQRNTRLTKDGKRACRECARIRQAPRNRARSQERIRNRELAIMAFTAECRMAR